MMSSIESAIYKYGDPEIDNDVLCICLGKFLENPLNRNILKIEEHSNYCLCLCDNNTWHAIPDSKAISEFVIKYMPIIYKKALAAYESFTDDSKTEAKENTEKLIFIIHQIMLGNQSITISVYERVKKLLYYITKRYNDNDTIILHTTV